MRTDARSEARRLHRDWVVRSLADSIVTRSGDGQTEHTALEQHGWRVVEWYRAGFLKGGMANQSEGAGTTQQKRERLWFSPACVRESKQAELF